MAELNPLAVGQSGDDDDEDFVDETLAERLVGLTEMFPQSVRSSCSSITHFTWRSLKGTLSFTCSAAWIFASTSSILLLPVLFEKDRANAQEQQMMQQRQILMGPNAAVSGQQGGPGMMGMMPPGMAPPPPSTATPSS